MMEIGNFCEEGPGENEVGVPSLTGIATHASALDSPAVFR